MAVVLVVNDDQDMLSAYEAALDAMGHQAVPRMDLEPKPEVVLKTGAEAVIIDLQAEADAHSGLRMIEALRKDPATQELPVILATGAATEAERLRRELATMRVPVLIKPFPMEKLQRVVEEVLPPQVLNPPGVATQGLSPDRRKCRTDGRR
jgi:DNA-binding NtrC family response regulator